MTRDKILAKIRWLSKEEGGRSEKFVGGCYAPTASIEGQVISVVVTPYQPQSVDQLISGKVLIGPLDTELTLNVGPGGLIELLEGLRVVAICEILEQEDKTTDEVLRTALVTHINSAYRRTRPGYISQGNAKIEKLKVDAVVDYASSVNIISHQEVQSIHQWLDKWSIHPGWFEWGIDWTSLRAARVPCQYCDGGHFTAGTNELHRCSVCGGRGFMNKAVRDK